MIDIHSHILPNLDDGARSMDESLEMARIAAEDGIEQMVATPHLFNGISHDPKPEEIKQRVRELQEEVGTLLEILPGNEVHLTHDVLSRLKAGEVMKLNNKNYVLIEFPTMNVPVGAAEILSGLQTAGVIPILVHPERNALVQSRPSIVEDLVRNGVRVQVTAMSVAGKFGTAAFDCAKKLLEHNCVHVIASDTHRPKGRPPVLSEGRDAAAEIIGVDAARRLVEDHPRAVIMGEAFEADPPLPFNPPGRETVFSRLFRRKTSQGSRAGE